MLTGKFSEDTTFDIKDHRNFNADGNAFNAGETFSGIDFKQGINLAAQMKAMLPDERMAEWALRWILDHDEVTSVIPGASKLSQVASNLAASDLDSLTVFTHQQLRELYDQQIKNQIRGHY